MRRRIPLLERLAAIPPFWRLVCSLMVAVMLLGAWLLAFVDTILVAGEGLPIALHSPLDADYSADAVAYIPAARINLLSDAIADQANDGTNSPEEQVATMVDQLRTPVFTVTPYPGMTSVPGAGPTQARATNTPSAPEQIPTGPSLTAAVPTVTNPAPVMPPSATPTPGALSQTRTPTITNPPANPTTAPTKTPYSTTPPIFATPTHTTAPTRVPPTQTPLPPTRTPVPPQPTETWTPIPQPTDTPVPPTSTPDDYPGPGYP